MVLPSMKHYSLILLLFSAIASQPTFADLGPAVGQRAPGFRLTDLKDNPVTLRELRSKGFVFVIFWSSRCHVCHGLISDFRKLNRTWKNKGLTVVAVNVGKENASEVKAYVAKNKIDYLVLNQDTRKLYLATVYQLRGTPTFKLINPKGIIVYHGHRIPDISKYLAKK